MIPLAEEKKLDTNPFEDDSPLRNPPYSDNTGYDFFEISEEDTPHFVFNTTADTTFERNHLQRYSTIQKIDPDKKGFNEEDRLIGSIDGVVLDKYEDGIRVKLYPETYVIFPHILFADSKKIGIGQHLEYRVRKNSRGHRFQEIILTEKKEANRQEKEILDIINDFKLRDE